MCVCGKLVLTLQGANNLMAACRRHISVFVIGKLSVSLWKDLLKLKVLDIVNICIYVATYSMILNRFFIVLIWSCGKEWATSEWPRSMFKIDTVYDGVNSTACLAKVKMKQPEMTIWQLLIGDLSKVTLYRATSLSIETVDDEGKTKKRRRQ